MAMDRTSYAILGTGALGGLYGGLLADSGLDVHFLLRSDYAFTQANFNPPPLAPSAEKANWTHADGSNLIAWAKRTRKSPVVAMDCGDGPPAYANPAFRKFVENALHWVASPEAKAWAAER